MRPCLLPLACAILAVPLAGGEAPADPQRAVAAAEAAAAATPAPGKAPAWCEDPLLNGAVPEAAAGYGRDAGDALAGALVDLARARQARISSQVPAGDAGRGGTHATQQSSAIRLGAFTLQSLSKDIIKEGGLTDGGKTESVFEEISRIVHPRFTIKRWVREEGNLAAAGSQQAARIVVEWTATAPIAGEEVASLLAADGLRIAAVANLPGSTDAALWLTCIPGDRPAPTAGPGALLPLQALAEAVLRTLAASGQDNLLGAEVTRPDARTLAISWPQGPARLTLTLDAVGRLVGLAANEEIRARGKDLPTLARESLEATAGALTVSRTGAGEVWKTGGR